MESFAFGLPPAETSAPLHQGQTMLPYAAPLHRPPCLDHGVEPACRAFARRLPEGVL